ncbi:MAG: ABC transporter substrate-binding protein [Pseudomonadota bacterium]
MIGLRTFLAGMLLTTGGAYAEEFPVTVTDARAAQVTIDQEPQRVVALGAFASDVLTALGKEPVGITTYEGERPVYLGKDLGPATDLGDLTAPNLELMATLNPDLVVGMLRYNGPYEEEITEIADFLAFDIGGIDVSDKNIISLGTALGQSEKALKLNETFAGLRANFEEQTGKQDVSYLFIWNFYDSMYAYQDNLMSAELLSGLGATNLAGFNEDAETPDQAVKVLEVEDLLALDPDVLLMFSSHGSTIKGSAALKRLKAVKEGRAFSVGFQYSQPDGPIAREMVLREAASLLFPGLFQAPALPENARATVLKFAD